MTIEELGTRLAEAHARVFLHNRAVDVFSIDFQDRKTYVIVLDGKTDEIMRAAAEAAVGVILKETANDKPA